MSLSPIGYGWRESEGRPAGPPREWWRVGTGRGCWSRSWKWDEERWLVRRKGVEACSCPWLAHCKPGAASADLSLGGFLALFIILGLLFLAYAALAAYIRFQPPSSHLLGRLSCVFSRPGSPMPCLFHLVCSLSCAFPHLLLRLRKAPRPPRLCIHVLSPLPITRPTAHISSLLLPRKGHHFR